MMGDIAASGQKMECNSGMPATPAFEMLGDDPFLLPVLLSVPHAGRNYPPSLLTRSRIRVDSLRRLEDRYADLLVAGLLVKGYHAIVARVPRALIDLNRDPRDIDPRTVTAMPVGQPLVQSAKQRGGLGLFPCFLPRLGDLWRMPMSWDEALGYIRMAHEPYHAAIARHMNYMREQHGQALLIDVHSMPPLTAGTGGGPRPDVVLGDRFGASASSRFAELARAIVSRHGFVAGINHPYSGYYLIERHGRPGNGQHALQIEISRDLYLDAALDGPGSGLPAIQAMLTELVEALGEEATRGGFAIAAE